MPRQTYREHRAQRAAMSVGSDTDLDSLASFSTFASHTTLSSLPAQYYAARNSPSIAQVWDAAGGRAAPRPRTGSSVSQREPVFHHGPPSAGLSSSLSPSLAPSSVPSGLPTPGLSAAPSDSTPGPGTPLGVPRRMSSQHLRTPSSGRSPSLSPAAFPGSPREHRSSSSSSHHRQHPPGSAAAEAETKRRRRARNEERWRRVRAREAAHDAPVRQGAKWAQARFGARGALGVAVAFAIALRIVVAVVMLCCSGTVRSAFAETLTLASAAHVFRPLRRQPPIAAEPSSATPVPPVNAPFGIKTAIAGLTMHLLVETLLWTAAVAWATLEGWRQGRTLRTRVGAVVFLCTPPVMALGFGSFHLRTAALGLVAWALVAACGGHDNLAAAALAAAVRAEPSMVVFVPSFAVYAVGKRFWLQKSNDYMTRIVVSVALGAFALDLPRGPLRERIGSAVSAVRTLASWNGFLGCLKMFSGMWSVKALIMALAIAPSSYLLLRASLSLRPRTPAQPTPAAPILIPPTARLLPLALTATTAAAAALRLPADTALPLVPLTFGSALRGDDDEWAVAVQAQLVTAVAMWPQLYSVGLLPLAGAYVLAWAWMLGARRGAPSVLGIHQEATFVLALLALASPVATLSARLIPGAILAKLAAAVPLIQGLHAAFIGLSMGLLAVWANVRLVKSAWAAGAL